MSCEARVLGHKSALEGFYSTKSCKQIATKRLVIADDHHRSCDECFRRYTKGTDWYGWMDYSFPPEAPVIGSQAFYLSYSKAGAVVTLPTQKAPLGSCGTCWRTSFERSECQVCHTEVCRACASVSPKGDKGDFCKRCVPRLLPVPKADPSVKVETEVEEVDAEVEVETEVDALTVQLSLMSVALYSVKGQAAVSDCVQPAKAPKAPKKSLDYPIRTDMAALSLDELKALHAHLVPWMKENQTKYPRLMIPYYNYRMKLESLMIQKK
jgi:hypothetical protein